MCNSVQVKKVDRFAVNAGQHHSLTLESAYDAAGMIRLYARKQRLDHSRMSWHHHFNQLLHEDEGRFVNEYTMSYGAHRELTEILRPYLQQKEHNSHSTEPIAVKHMVPA